jgi:uncharacterized protein (TIGR03437 family)
VDPLYQPSWLTVTPNTYPADGVGATPVTFTAAVSNGSCSGALNSTKSAVLHLLNSPATAYKTLTVTMQVVGPSGLTLGSSPSPVTTNPNVYAISYTKNGNPSYLNLTVKGSVYFSVNTSLVPSWLTVNAAGGEATSGGFPLQFMVTKVADTMAPGVLPTVLLHLTVPGQADFVFGVTLTVSNALPTLSVAEGTVRNLTWTVGTPLPTPNVTALSTGAPISIGIAGAAASSNGTSPIPIESTALAFSFGTAIPVSFNPSDFANVQPGTTLSGTITLSCASTACYNTSLVVNFAVTVQTATINAVLTGVSPTNLPTAVSGQTFTVTLYGAGFVFNSGATQNTNVGIVTTGVMAPDANISANVLNASTIILTITVPVTADSKMGFAAPGTITLGVCNPFGAASCNTPTGTVTLITGAGPIIQTGGVTSASTFQTVTPGTGTVAPYDILSIFGSNFCSSLGTGCTSGQVLYPAETNSTYGSALTPDGGVRNLQVFFYSPPGQTSTGLGAAPLLFGTNNQINVMVPGALAASTQYDIVVKFGTLASTAYTVTGAASDLGVFVIDPSNNLGAIELPSGAIVGNSSTTAARMRAVAGNSDVVSIYMTGLGLPLSTQLNTQGGYGSPTVLGDCISPTAYKAAAGGLTSLDGVIIQGALIAAGRFAPCFDPTTITAKVGNVAGTVTYAGWVEGSVAGLYQVNVQLPAIGALYKWDGSTGTPAAGALWEVPVQVSLTSGTSSQAYNAANHVGIYVEPAATVVPGTGSTLYSQTMSSLSGATSLAPVSLDALTCSLMTTPGYAVTAVSGIDSTGRAAQLSDFSVTGGALGVNYAFLGTGVFKITVTVTDSGGSGYPPEIVTFTLTIPS